MINQCSVNVNEYKMFHRSIFPDFEKLCRERSLIEADDSAFAPQQSHEMVEQTLEMGVLSNELLDHLGNTIGPRGPDILDTFNLARRTIRLLEARPVTGQRT